MNKIIDYIESHGFKVVGRNITKRSKTTRHRKTVGTLNDNNFFFYSDNVHPFKAGLNFFNDTTIVDNDSHKEYIYQLKEKERNDFEVKFEAYYDATTQNSTFNTFLNNTTRKFISKNSSNFFDLRGIRKGYLEGAVCFPFIDINNEFVTAQIIKYGANGKRIKSSFSQNWFHSYKPIKNTLGLNINDKYNVAVKCFFGENQLKDSVNIVGIVEAPKTAVILKEIYPNIDWIATAGEQALFNKDLSLLEDRKVVLFADAHTTKWKEFAGKKGYNYCDILDIEDIEAGSDIADFVLDENSIIFEQLNEYLFCLNDGDFNFELNKDLLDFDFRVVKEEQGYFTAVPYYYRGNDILHQQDTSKDLQVDFKGKHFNIYSEKYEILNAQIDWHKQDRKEDNKLVGMSKDSFVWHLQKCYRTLKHLNKNLGNDVCLDVFEKTLNTLLRESNFKFNKSYVLSRLVPLWDSYNADLNRFKKHRNWKYKGKKQLTRKEFERELNNDNFRAKLNVRLLAFKDVLKEKRFIDIETDLGLNKHYKNRGYLKLFNLVSKWNKEVIGASTLKSYFNNLSFYKKLEEFENLSCDLDKLSKKLPPHIDVPYRVATKRLKKLSKQQLMFITDTKTYKKLNEILSFKSDADAGTLIENEVESILKDINDIEPLRSEINGTTRIYTFEYVKPANEWSVLYDNRGEWFNSMHPANNRFSTLYPIFLNKAELERELKQVNTKYLPLTLDKATFEANRKSSIKDSINYLTHLEAVKNKEVSVDEKLDSNFKTYRFNNNNNFEPQKVAVNF